MAVVSVRRLFSVVIDPVRRSRLVFSQHRTAVSSSTALFYPNPRKCTSLGLMRIMMVVAPFLYIGTQISKNFAALLEEHDIFVPEDDDDDD